MKVDDMEEWEIEESYVALLDEPGIMTETGTVVLGSLEYDVSQVLREVDPTAFRIGLSEHEDYLRENESEDDDDDTSTE